MNFLANLLLQVTGNAIPVSPSALVMQSAAYECTHTMLPFFYHAHRLATLAEVNAIIERLNNGDAFPPNADVVIGIPSMYLLHAKANFRSDIFTCAEDIGLKPGVGACTGEICSAMLKDAGIGWTIVGHSERRVGFGIPVRHA